MTLREQFENEMDLQKKQYYEYMRKNATNFSTMQAVIIAEYLEYINWLEERLTWKKFSEQKPEEGRDVIIKKLRYLYRNITFLEIKENMSHEWMYVQK